MIKVKVVQSKLLDGSRVYDVHVRDCDAEPLVLNAPNKVSANNLACGIYTAVCGNATDNATLEVL